MTGLAGRIAGLFVYPIKGCAAVPLALAELDAKGLLHDRRLAVTTPSGRVLTQREHPELARIHASLDAEGGLKVQVEGRGFEVPERSGGPTLEVRIWRDSVRAERVEGELADAITGLLGVPSLLVRFAPETVRACDPTFAPPGAETAFADGFPLLVTNEASLVQLDEWLLEVGAEPVPMSRFRPNVVIADLPAWGEDDHDTLESEGGLVLDLVKPCTRCIVTTIDQDRGEVHGDQPLAMLRRARRHPVLRQPTFGQNAVPRLGRGARASLRIGDSVMLCGSARS